MEIANYIITGLSLLAAILAWVAKIRWSKEYSQAKDEILRLKDSENIILKDQIQRLKDFNPVVIGEFYDRSKKDYEDYIDKLKKQVCESEQLITDFRVQIENSNSKSQEDLEQILKLKKKIAQITVEQEKVKSLLSIEPKFPSPDFSYDWLQNMTAGSAALSNSTGNPFIIKPSKYTMDIAELMYSRPDNSKFIVVDPEKLNDAE